MDRGRLREALQPDDARDAARLLAGLLIAVAALLLVIRRETASSLGSGSGDEFVLFLIWALPAALLIWLGLVGASERGAAGGWPAVHTVAGAILVPFAAGQLIETLDQTPDSTLQLLISFLVGAAAAVLIWRAARVRYQLLLAGIFTLVAWVTLWDKLLGDGGVGDNLDGFRWTLIALAIAFVFAARAIRQEATEEPEQAASELITAAGIAVVFASLISLVGGFIVDLIPFGELTVDVPEPDVLWDLITFASGLALVFYASLSATRGPAYVGALLLFLFAISVGSDLDGTGSPDGSVAGWPIIVLVAGLALLVWSLSARGGGDGPPAAPTAAVPPAAGEPPAAGPEPADQPWAQPVTPEPDKPGSAPPPGPPSQ